MNHFPGSGSLTNKVQLVMNDFKFIPKAFQMPSQKQTFLEYVSVNIYSMNSVLFYSLLLLVNIVEF